MYNTVEAKEDYINKNIEYIVSKIYPRTKTTKKSMILTNIIPDGKIFGCDGIGGYNTVFWGIVRKSLDNWRVLQALDQDYRCGNLSTVGIMWDVEGLERYERGVFHGKIAISRVAKKLEAFAEDYVSYECYVSETGHRNIDFDYESVLMNFLKDMILMEKVESECVSICFT